MSVQTIEAAREWLQKVNRPHKHLELLHEHMRERKRELDALLNLSEANKWRHVVTLTKDEEEVRQKYQLTYAAILGLLDIARSKGSEIILSSAHLVKNEVMVKGQVNKLSKVLAKVAEENTHVIETCMKELKISKHSQFLPKLGDIVKSGRKVVLSSNMLDFLTASDNSSFRSCHSFDGCHFNGNIGFARDSITMVAYTTKESAKMLEPMVYKEGRGWMFVVDDKIALAKSYGNFHEFERKMAVSVVQNALAVARGYENDWTVKNEQSYQDSHAYVETPADKQGERPMYIDGSGLLFAQPKHKSWGNVKLQLAPAICLTCGCTTTNSDHGECYPCKNAIKCEECGERVQGGKVKAAGGHHYCLACFEKKYFTCACCGENKERGKARTVDGKVICGGCVERYYVTCAGCGELKRKEDCGRYAGIEGPICDPCLEGYTRCDSCGEWKFKQDIVMNSGYPICISVCGGAQKYIGPDFVPCEELACIKGLPHGWKSTVMVIG